MKIDNIYFPDQYSASKGIYYINLRDSLTNAKELTNNKHVF